MVNRAGRPIDNAGLFFESELKRILRESMTAPDRLTTDTRTL
jgi:hypothetical protein